MMSTSQSHQKWGDYRSESGFPRSAAWFRKDFRERVPMTLVPRGLCCKGASILIQPMLLSRVSNSALKGSF
jgi:hypothetical protein